MKVLFDISSSKIANTGVSIYQQELLGELNKIVGLTVDEICYEPKFSRESRLRAVDSVYRDLFWQTLKVGKKADQVKADILHFPAFNFPVRSKHKMVITVHDIYSIIKPDNYHLWHRKIVNRYIKSAIEQQRQVLVPTLFVKQEILRHFSKAQEEYIHVIHSGISDKRVGVENDLLFKKISEKYLIKQPYILSVSTIEPRKNFFNLILGFSLIADKVDHALVLVGQNGWKNKKIYELIHKLRLQNRIRFTGYVPDEELNLLYSYASSFVFPSYYEGFGFTPLEAMKCGCPVISSNASCMPEVLGDAVMYFEPNDIEGMASAILKIIEDESLLSKMKKVGLEHASQYSWRTAALETYRLYHKILNSN